MPLHRKLYAWLSELVLLFRRKLWAVLHTEPPSHYLGHIVDGKIPVVLVPGIANTWSSMKRLGDSISRLGHPVYVVSELKNNLHFIADAAAIVRRKIIEENITSAVVIGHSKGGLVGKYYLMHYNSDQRVRGVVAIAAPFAGSTLANFYGSEAFKELRIKSAVLSSMSENVEANSRIISIYPAYDTHVWSEAGCYLEGAARNVELPLAGHNAILLNQKTMQTVHAAIDELGSVSERKE